MYNEELKKKYIEDNKFRNLNLEKQCEVLFKRCQPYEERLNKDISCFSTLEIIECFKSFNTVSLESLMNAKSQYKIYTDWCINHEGTNITVETKYQNHFREVNLEMLKRCLNYYLMTKRVITRDYILNNWDVLLNPVEKFIMLGIFEGIGANTNIAYKDFEGLTIDNFDTKTHKLKLKDRLINFSNELYQVAKESADATELLVYAKSGREMHIRLTSDRDGLIVKPACNAKSFDYRNILLKKMQKIKDAFDNYIITLQLLKESGRIEMINKLVATGMTIEDALSDKEVVNTYGAVTAKKRYISNYFAAE